MAKLPANGMIIVFDRVPPGSYAQAGERYRVDHYVNKRTGRASAYYRWERLDGPNAGAATSDGAWAVARSEWREVA